MIGFLIRLIAALGLAWGFGFLWFAVTLPEPVPAAVKTDGIVVLTGGPGRLARGVELMQAGAARRMLVSGVDPSVRAVELAAELKVPNALFDCCIDLGQEAVDTRSNADETAAWVQRHRYKSLRLVTSAWHMRRAQLELEARLGPEIRIVADPVPRELPADRLAREFTKYALRFAALQMGVA